MTEKAIFPEEALQEFRMALGAKLIEPHNEHYDAARRVWNGMIDRKPALIARCAGVSDVLAAVGFASRHRIPAAIRGGGHNVAGNAVCDGGLVIDLSQMQSVRVDPKRRTARAEPGVTWGRLDRETQAFGLAVPGGLISTTGIAGFTLGGGIGWLTRKYGLTCDNLISADVVAADGRFLQASANENPELFYGIRGGGGNFGVVTSFEYQLHPVGPMVLGGVAFYRGERAVPLLRFYRDFVKEAPEELTSAFVFLTGPPFLPPGLKGAPLVGIALLYAGPIDEGAPLVERLRSFGAPDVDLLGPMPYVALQTMQDGLAPSGLQNYWKSETMAELSDEAMATLVAKSATMPSPMTHIDIHHLGGAMSRATNGESAFNQRDAQYIVNIVSTWTDPAAKPAQVAWTRGVWEALRPFSTGGAYLNFLGDEGDDRVRAAYGEAKYQRLAKLKREYDPENLFRFNQNIQPGE